ncbi:unnamed protein product [Amoebophrya sp. A120]|nr:unnamed protein product [Amoebophrya sp. A120]|eukprot:GSA120T00017319001.1
MALCSRGRSLAMVSMIIVGFLGWPLIAHGRMFARVPAGSGGGAQSRSGSPASSSEGSSSTGDTSSGSAPGQPRSSRTSTEQTTLEDGIVEFLEESLCFKDPLQKECCNPCCGAPNGDTLKQAFNPGEEWGLLPARPPCDRRPKVTREQQHSALVGEPTTVAEDPGRHVPGSRRNQALPAGDQPFCPDLDLCGEDRLPLLCCGRHHTVFPCENYCCGLTLSDISAEPYSPKPQWRCPGAFETCHSKEVLKECFADGGYLRKAACTCPWGIGGSQYEAMSPVSDDEVARDAESGARRRPRPRPLLSGAASHRTAAVMPRGSGADDQLAAERDAVVDGIRERLEARFQRDDRRSRAEIQALDRHYARSPGCCDDVWALPAAVRGVALLASATLLGAPIWLGAVLLEPPVSVLFGLGRATCNRCSTLDYRHSAKPPIVDPASWLAGESDLMEGEETNAEESDAEGEEKLDDHLRVVGNLEMMRWLDFLRQLSWLANHAVPQDLYHEHAVNSMQNAVHAASSMLGGVVRQFSGAASSAGGSQPRAMGGAMAPRVHNGLVLRRRQRNKRFTIASFPQDTQTEQQQAGRASANDIRNPTLADQYYDPELYVQTMMDGRSSHRSYFTNDEEKKLRDVVNPEGAAWGPWLTTLTDDRFFRNEFFNSEDHWSDLLQSLMRLPESTNAEKHFALLSPLAFLHYENRRLGNELQLEEWEGDMLGKGMKFHVPLQLVVEYENLLHAIPKYPGTDGWMYSRADRRFIEGQEHPDLLPVPSGKAAAMALNFYLNLGNKRLVENVMLQFIRREETGSRDDRRVSRELITARQTHLNNPYAGGRTEKVHTKFILRGVMGFQAIKQALATPMLEGIFEQFDQMMTQIDSRTREDQGRRRRAKTVEEQLRHRGWYCPITQEIMQDPVVLQVDLESLGAQLVPSMVGRVVQGGSTVATGMARWWSARRDAPDEPTRELEDQEELEDQQEAGNVEQPSSRPGDGSEDDRRNLPEVEALYVSVRPGKLRPNYIQEGADMWIPRQPHKHVFERHAIETHLRASDIHPMTRSRLRGREKDLISFEALQTEIKYVVKTAYFGEGADLQVLLGDLFAKAVKKDPARGILATPSGASSSSAGRSTSRIGRSATGSLQFPQTPGTQSRPMRPDQLHGRHEFLAAMVVGLGHLASPWKTSPARRSPARQTRNATLAAPATAPAQQTMWSVGEINIGGEQEHRGGNVGRLLSAEPYLGTAADKAQQMLERSYSDEKRQSVLDTLPSLEHIWCCHGNRNCGERMYDCCQGCGESCHSLGQSWDKAKEVFEQVNSHETKSRPVGPLDFIDMALHHKPPSNTETAEGSSSSRSWWHHTYRAREAAQENYLQVLQAARTALPRGRESREALEMIDELETLFNQMPGNFYMHFHNKASARRGTQHGGDGDCDQCCDQAADLGCCCCCPGNCSREMEAHSTLAFPCCTKGLECCCCCHSDCCLGRVLMPTFACEGLCDANPDRDNGQRCLKNCGCFTLGKPDGSGDSLIYMLLESMVKSYHRVAAVPALKMQLHHVLSTERVSRAASGEELQLLKEFVEKTHTEFRRKVHDMDAVKRRAMFGPHKTLASGAERICDMCTGAHPAGQDELLVDQGATPESFEENRLPRSHLDAGDGPHRECWAMCGHNANWCAACSCRGLALYGGLGCCGATSNVCCNYVALPLHKCGEEACCDYRTPCCEGPATANCGRVNSAMCAKGCDDLVNFSCGTWCQGCCVKLAYSGSRFSSGAVWTGRRARGYAGYASNRCAPVASRKCRQCVASGCGSAAVLCCGGNTVTRNQMCSLKVPGEIPGFCCNLCSICGCNCKHVVWEPRGDRLQTGDGGAVQFQSSGCCVPGLMRCGLEACPGGCIGSFAFPLVAPWAGLLADVGVQAAGVATFAANVVVGDIIYRGARYVQFALTLLGRALSAAGQLAKGTLTLVYLIGRGLLYISALAVAWIFYGIGMGVCAIGEHCVVPALTAGFQFVVQAAQALGVLLEPCGTCVSKGCDRCTAGISAGCTAAGTGISNGCRRLASGCGRVCGSCRDGAAAGCSVLGNVLQELYNLVGVPLMRGLACCCNCGTTCCVGACKCVFKHPRISAAVTTLLLGTGAVAAYQMGKMQPLLERLQPHVTQSSSPVDVVGSSSSTTSLVDDPDRHDRYVAPLGVASPYEMSMTTTTAWMSPASHPPAAPTVPRPAVEPPRLGITSTTALAAQQPSSGVAVPASGGTWAFANPAGGGPSGDLPATLTTSAPSGEPGKERKLREELPRRGDSTILTTTAKKNTAASRSTTTDSAMTKEDGGSGPGREDPHSAEETERGRREQSEVERERREQDFYEWHDKNADHFGRFPALFEQGNLGDAEDFLSDGVLPEELQTLPENDLGAPEETDMSQIIHDLIDEDARLRSRLTTGLRNRGSSSRHAEHEDKSSPPSSTATTSKRRTENDWRDRARSFNEMYVRAVKETREAPRDQESSSGKFWLAMQRIATATVPPPTAQQTARASTLFGGALVGTSRRMANAPAQEQMKMGSAPGEQASLSERDETRRKKQN